MIYAADYGGEIEEESTLDLYVRPDGWRMEPGATAVNGLTDDFLRAHGLPVSEILDRYEQALVAGYIVVAFHAQFDLKIMRGEFRRLNRPDHFETTKNICVMRGSLGVCRIPKKHGGGWKFPKLEEACAHFKIPYTKKHQAPADAEAAYEIFKWLRRINCCPEPEVHYNAHHAEIQARGQPLMDTLQRVADEADQGVPDENVYPPQPSYRVVE